MALPDFLRRLTPEHEARIWEVLGTRYGYNVTYWRARFEESYRKQPRGFERLEFLMLFGVREINPIMNRVLGRDEQHGTFLLMVQEMVKDASRVKKRKLRVFNGL